MIDEDELESIFSATYFEDFVDSCENLPFQVLKSLYHERLDSVDLDSEETLRDIEDLVYGLLERCESSGQNFLFSQMLVRLEELTDYAEEAASERCGVIGELQDYLEEKARVLELDRKNMITKQSIEQPGLLRDDISDTEGGTNVKVETPIAPASKPVGRPPKNRRSKRKSTPLPVRDIDVFGDQSIEEVYHSGNDTSTLLDHSETHGGSMKSSSPVELTASPKERRRRKNGVKRRRKTRTPRTYGKTRSHLSKALKYCICKEDCPGDMIGCDNRGSCPVEWFHFACLQLTSKPRGKWYCPMCRGSRANVLKTTDTVADNDSQEDMETNVF